LGEHFSARKSALACYLYVVWLEEAIEHQQQYIDIKVKCSLFVDVASLGRLRENARPAP
jgi:hypothetical protein